MTTETGTAGNVAAMEEAGCWVDGSAVVQMAGTPIPVMQSLDTRTLKYPRLPLPGMSITMPVHIWRISNGQEHGEWCDTATEAVAAWNAAHGWPLEFRREHRTK